MDLKPIIPDVIRACYHAPIGRVVPTLSHIRRKLAPVSHSFLYPLLLGENKTCRLILIFAVHAYPVFKNKYLKFDLNHSWSFWVSLVLMLLRPIVVPKILVPVPKTLTLVRDVVIIIVYYLSQIYLIVG